MVQFNIILAAFCLAFPAMGVTGEIHSIVDTDMDSDDVLALLILGKHTKIVAVTCNSVEHSIKTVEERVKSVLKLMPGNENVKVLTGPQQNLIGEKSKVEGEQAGKDHEAAHEIVAALKDDAVQETIYALGTLTNLALAELHHEGILKKAQNIYIIGGTEHGFGGLKNSPWLEPNMYRDPEAARLIFTRDLGKDKLFHLLTHDVCHDLKFTGKEREEIAGTHLSTLNEMESKEDKENWTPCDSLLVLLSIKGHGDLATVQHADVEVETCGTQGRGAMFMALLNANDEKVDSIVYVKLQEKIKNELKNIVPQ